MADMVYFSNFMVHSVLTGRDAFLMENTASDARRPFPAGLLPRILRLHLRLWSRKDATF